MSFYVYFHSRPDGSVFYIGKGTGRRAWDLAPSRRKRHHRNTVEKYGLKNIIVEVIYCASEAEAIELEREHIARAKEVGARIANLTDGGEGASGRQWTDEQRAKVASSVRRVWASRPRKATKLPRTIACRHCSVIFEPNGTALVCSHACRLAALRALRPDKPARRYSNNKSGHPGVYQVKNGNWIAYVGKSLKLIHLGTFKSFDDACAARRDAVVRLGVTCKRGPRRAA